MTEVEFQKVVDKMLCRCRDILLNKGPDYASKEDRLANFKVNATRWGLSPIQVWAVYYGKQMDAICQYVKKGELTGEPIEERIADGINYLLLLQGLVYESTDKKYWDISEPVKQKEKANETISKNTNII